MPRYSSNMMQPMDHTSHGCDQPNSVKSYEEKLNTTILNIYKVNRVNFRNIISLCVPVTNVLVALADVKKKA